jgi:hypothetical protein
VVKYYAGDYRDELKELAEESNHPLSIEAKARHITEVMNEQGYRIVIEVNSNRYIILDN